MAKKKTARKKSGAKRKPKSGSLGFQLIKSAIAFLILIALVAAAVLLLNRFIMRKQLPEPSSESQARPAQKTPAPRRPVYEVYPKPEPGLQPAPAGSSKGKLPQVAIIIDDLGYDGKIANAFLALDAVLTFSILPYSPLQKEIATAAHTKGNEVMLHLPMEPKEYPAVDPGPGTLLVSMTPDQLIAQLRENLGMVPFVSGVNNHMGSKMTAASSQIYQIFSTLKQSGLYFIDSRTTSESLCQPSARMLKLPFAQRDIFIDHQQNEAFIEKQFGQMIAHAYRNGYSVAIAHPHALTVKVLERMLPELKKRVRLVPASEVVRLQG